MARNKQSRPRGLSRDAARLWDQLTSDYDFSSDAGGLALVKSLCETLSRLKECQETIAEEGLTVAGSTGQTRPHPLLAVENECRRVLLAHYRALRLAPEEY